MVLKNEYIVAGIIIALLIGSGVGYIYGQSPIAGYKEEVDRLEAENINIQDQLTEVKEDLSSTRSSLEDLQFSYSNLQGNYITLNKNFSDLQQDYSSLNKSFTILSQNYTSLKETYRQVLTSYASLQKNYTTLLTSYSGLQRNYAVLNASYADALKKISDLQSQLSNFSNLQNQLQTLQTQYNALQTQYNTISSSQSLYIGTTLETYYDYMRINKEPVKHWWSSSSSYYQTSVTFAADLASHDIGNYNWPSLEGDYLSSEGEYSYQTSSKIMQRVMTLAGISSSDDSVTKIQKTLTFIYSVVHYENRLFDEMWFPCETLTFHSGDCTGFSILAAAIFEEAGIKSAVAFFTSAKGAHAMVLVYLQNLGGYGYYYYPDLTSYGLKTGRWIVIEPQFSSLSSYSSNLAQVSQWNIVAASEVPYGP